MALEFTLHLSKASASKLVLDEILTEQEFDYEKYETLRSGFRIDDFMDTTGFSLAFVSHRKRFGWEDSWLAEPFMSESSVSFRMSQLIEWPLDIENMAKIILALLSRIDDDALLVSNDVINMARLNNQYYIRPEKTIWETPTGLAFLEKTPHTLIE